MVFLSSCYYRNTVSSVRPGNWRLSCTGIPISTQPERQLINDFVRRDTITSSVKFVFCWMRIKPATILSSKCTFHISHLTPAPSTKYGNQRKYQFWRIRACNTMKQSKSSKHMKELQARASSKMYKSCSSPLLFSQRSIIQQIHAIPAQMVDSRARTCQIVSICIISTGKEWWEWKPRKLTIAVLVGI